MLMSAAAISWGLSSATSKVALGQLSPIDLMAIEVGTGAVVLIPLAALRGGTVRSSALRSSALRGPGLWRPRLLYLLLGILEPGLAFLLFDVGLARTSATHAALLLASETLFVVILARLALHERMSSALALAVGAGFERGVAVHPGDVVGRTGGGGAAERRWVGYELE